MKIGKKSLFIIVILALILLIFSTVCFGDYTPSQFNKEINTTSIGTKNVKNVGGKIVGITQVVGTIAAVGMLIVLGIKYMIGSAEERADYKKTMFPYIVGATLIFAASNLSQIIYTWAINI